MKIADIAKLAGVSTATVSRVLNHPEMVKEETRKRVLEIIEKHGYEPNRIARSLRVRSTGNIGLIVPVESGSVFESPYFGLLLRGMSEASDLRNFHIIFSTSHQDNVKVFENFLKKSIVDGFVVLDVRDEDPRVKFLKSHDVYFVVVGRPKGVGDYIYVDSDNFEGAYKATAHLLRTGHERIAFLNGPEDHSVSRDRLLGFLKAHDDLGVQPIEDLIMHGKFTEESGYEMTKKVLKRGVDAIFYSGDVMAFGGMMAIRENGMEIGRDISIIGFDDVPASRVVTPPLSSVRQPIMKIGREAVNILIDLIEGKKVRSKVFPTELILRGSVRVMK